jgi:hypothetical protein
MSQDKGEGQPEKPSPKVTQQPTQTEQRDNRGSDGKRIEARRLR